VTGLYQLAVGSKTVPLSSCLLRGGDDQPVDFGYSFWLVDHAGGLLLVDCGFREAAAARKSIRYERTPLEALALLGIGGAEIDGIVLTHLHFDHAGALPDFPNARVYVQARDLEYFTGPLMRFPLCASGIDADDMTAVERIRGDGRLEVLAGDAEIVPGVRAQVVGGHTPGSQLVSVRRGDRRVVLAGDAAHIQANITLGVPYPVLHSVPDSCLGFEAMREMARDDRTVVIPGHDGAVRRDSTPVSDVPGRSVVELL